MSNESEHLTPDEEKTQQPEPVEAASPLAEASQQTPETAGNLSSDEAETPAEESSGRADSSAR